MFLISSKKISFLISKHFAIYENVKISSRPLPDLKKVIILDIPFQLHSASPGFTIIIVIHFQQSIILELLKGRIVPGIIPI